MVPFARLGLVLLAAAAATRTSWAQAPGGDLPPPPPPEPSAPLDPQAARLAALERKVAELEAARAPAGSAPWWNGVQLSGYLQPRYERHQDAWYGVDPDTREPRGTTRFLIRRARIGASYQAKSFESWIQIGSEGADVRLLDAEATFVDTWTPLGLRLTMGQFLIPFGFEILQRSVNREMPERALMVRQMFPGVRDRGLRVQGGYGPIHFIAALINGNGIENPIYGAFDETSWKDVVGRVAFTFATVSGGVSAYYGHALRTILPVDPTGTPSYGRYDRVRAGADVQVKVAGVPAAGPLVARAEVIWSDDTAATFSGVPGNPCNDVESVGWYATLIQPLGPQLALFGRLDDYNPRRALPPSCPGTTRDDRTTTVGGGAQGFLTPQLKLSVVYEHLLEEGPNRGNDVFTAQAQAVF